MISRLSVFTLALCALGVSSLSAMTAATDHPGSVAILLGVEKVRTTLRLTSLQKAVLDSLRTEYKTDARKLTDPMPVTPAERATAEQKLLQLNQHYNQRALSVLNDTQLERFVQIEHHVLGPLNLYSPSVQKSLALTPVQEQKIEKIRATGLLFVAKTNRKYEEGKIGYQERLELFRKEKDANGAALLKILTPAQQTSFADLTKDPTACAKSCSAKS